MKNDVIMGCIWVFMALLMLLCVFVNINNDNWEAMPICVFALILNTVNAVSRFKSYRRIKNWHKSFDNMEQYLRDLWPDEEDYRQS